MGEQRINPETGVIEEDQSIFGGVFGHDWQPVQNDQGNQERVNPETSVHEEDQSVFGGVFGHDWQPVSNERGRHERTNPESGVNEDDQSVFHGTFGHDWQPVQNDQGNQERVNPSTGMREEDQSVFGGVFGHDWQPAQNEQGKSERINPETGIFEEDQSIFGGVFGHDWQPKQNENRGSLRFPGERRMGETKRTGEGGGSDLGTDSTYSSSGSSLSFSQPGIGVFAALFGIAAFLLIVVWLSTTSSTPPSPSTFIPPSEVRSRTIAPSKDSGSRSSLQSKEMIIQSLAQEKALLLQNLSWIEPSQIVLSEPATFQFGFKPYRSGYLTILTDGIEIEVPNGGGRWQFWKIQSIDIGRVLMTSYIKFKFDPLYSGAENVKVIRSSGDFVLDTNLEVLFERIKSVRQQWTESEFGQRQLSARTRLKQVEDEIARLKSNTVMDTTASRQTSLSNTEEAHEAAPSIVGQATLPTCYDGIWAENNLNQFRWKFTTTEDGSLHIQRNDDFVAGAFVRTKEGWTGTLQWGNGETWHDVVLFEPNESCNEIRTNQSWWYKRR